MPTDSQDGPPKTEFRAEAFSALREQSHTQIERETAERIKVNPKPSEEEINAGAFPEMLEPQVRDAVFEMRKKGYATESSGFGGETGEAQSIDGYFEIDEKTERVLRDLGVQVGRDEGFGPKYAFLRFSPDEPSLEKMKAKWDEVARLLPDRGQQAEPSVSGHAEEFVKEHAPERTDVLQRIVEIREQHDKETEEAVAKKGAEASERVLGPFSPEEIKTAQSWASEYVVGYVKGERGLKGEYSDDEKKLLDNLGAKVRKSMRENPDTPINVDLSGDPQAYTTWTKLINRMARGSIEAKRRLADQTKIEEIRQELGLSKQVETVATPEATVVPEQEGKMDEYLKLPNVDRAYRTLLEKLGKDFVSPGDLKSSIYEMLVTRSTYAETKKNLGRFQKEIEEYEKAATDLREQLKKDGAMDTVVDPRMMDNPGWLHIVTRPEAKGKVEGVSKKRYATIPLESHSFIHNIGALAHKLREIATQNDDAIEIKFPEGFESFAQHNDSVVIHFKKETSEQLINDALQEYLSSMGIREGERALGRTTVAMDSKDTSFSDLVALNIGRWLDQNHKKYPAETLAKLAVRHAIEQAQKPPEVSKE